MIIEIDHDEGVANRIKDIHGRSRRAARQVGRSDIPALIAVSKNVSMHMIQAALNAGQRYFGESRVQEAHIKWASLKQDYPDLRLHLIGPLQTNKIKLALELFDVIQTLDRVRLAEKLANIAAQGNLSLPELLIQVNIGEEPQKAGIVPRQASLFIRNCLKEWNLPVTGLMAIPPLRELSAPHFALLARMAARHDLRHLSMGMSGDFEQAVMLGATYIRVGKAIFGAN